MTNNQTTLFIELYNDNHAWLFSWLKKKVRCHSDASDVTQDTFINLLTKADLTTLREPKAFLKTIANHQIINRARRIVLEQEYLRALSFIHSNDDFYSVEDRYLAIETLLSISAMLEDLPVNVRLTFLMSKLEDASHTKIAEKLGVSVSMVKKYLAQSLIHCYQIIHA